MQYDPIKRKLGVFFNQSPFLRKSFYSLLDLLLLRAWHIRKEFGKLSKTLPADLKILDAGSGFGQYVYRMSRSFPNSSILGVDVKEEQIKDCNDFFRRIGLGERVCFESADLTQYCHPNKFDLILSVDVMEHITEDIEVMKNFYASLRPGGWLLISTPSDQGGSEAHDHNHEEEATGFIDEHVRDGYNIDDIARKLKAAGFSKVEARYSYGTPGKLSWKISMKYPILLLGFSKWFFILLPFYYLIGYPVAFILNIFDVSMVHHSGTGLIVKAQKTN